MKGEGAIVFLIVFAVLLAVTIGSPSIPPGKNIFDLLEVAETDTEVLGVPVVTLVSAVFNGVIYGIIGWLVFTIFRRTTKKRKQEQIQQSRDQNA